MVSNGGLSSRVMNMKFMQKAEVVEQEKKEEENNQKLKDLSEWALPNATKLASKAKYVAQPIGFTNVSQFEEGQEVMVSGDTPVVGRRNFGIPKETSTTLEAEKGTSPKEDSKEFLDNLWKKQNKDSKKQKGRLSALQPNENTEKNTASPGTKRAITKESTKESTNKKKKKS